MLYEEALVVLEQLAMHGEARGVRERLAHMPKKAPAEKARPLPAGLSEREVEVLRLRAAGKTNRQIAEALVLSERTVANHLAHIFNKTDTDNRAAAADYVPSSDATVVARLRGAGAILLGKGNLPPLAGDGQTDNPLFGRTNNPWNLERTPGGSSGGSAAALAAGLTALELGSDIAGSVRVPAHYCGVCGLKPTEHLVPLSGHIPEPPGAPRGVRHMGQSAHSLVRSMTLP